jgi:hypothetical protein
MISRCCLCVCVCVFPPPPVVARKRLGNEHKRNNRRIVGRVVFNVARVVSRKVGDYFFPELLVYICIYFAFVFTSLYILRSLPPAAI